MKQHVLVVDDHPQIAELLAIHLQEDFEVSAAASGEQMRVHLQAKQFAVTILDLELKHGQSGLDHIATLHDAGSRVLVFSGTLDPGCIRTCYAQKVAGVMDKSEPIKELAKAIRAVAAGHRILPDHILGALTGSKDDIMPELTHREAEVLNLHFQVPLLTQTAIAKNLGLSIGRISNISTSIQQKLGVVGRDAMVEEAKRRGHRTSLPLPKKDSRERDQ